MQVPSTFEEGFTWPAFFGALFVALLMVPGAMYMSLIAGAGIGSAAQWVTVILFIEVARRANKTLKRAEIFTLFYLAGAALATPFSGILWNQFFAQSVSAQAHGITEHLPYWIAPVDPAVLAQRSLFQWEWLPALGLIIFSTFMSRIDNMVLGYGLFRLTSDIERLPFPMAPLGAQGILALSEEQEEEKLARGDDETEKPRSWRWRVFSVGSFLGLAFGLIYLAVPTVTGALLGKPIVLLPIPWLDWTQSTSPYLPAVATGLSLDAGQLFVGMVLPFQAIIGSLIGLMATFIANPMLYQGGVLKSWTPGDNTVSTLFKNNLDFYFSFGIGLSLSIAVVGLIAVVRGFADLRNRRKASGGLEISAVPEGRGDIGTRLVILCYLVSTVIYILVSGWLIDWHAGVMMVMVFYGFLYTPLISYATARLEGIAGQVITIPMIREASFILSGYQGVAIWFLPIPMHNYGAMTVFYRQCELTGTRFKSIWKSEILLTPIILVSSLLFAHFVWSLAPIPGPQYPYAQAMWEMQAENQAIVFSSTLGGYSLFEEAFRWDYVLYGLGLGGASFGAMNWLHLPTFLIYGVVRGLGQMEPHTIIPQVVGALLGRYYFQRRLGLKWRQYVPVVAAGFSCGMGLIATLSIGCLFLIKSVFQLPY
ncbi:peptide transporter [Verrucomicrobia bacterium LW23]|nr:peptide transporter [Verrucomicrobia bacterium LW23]